MKKYLVPMIYISLLICPAAMIIPVHAAEAGSSMELALRAAKIRGGDRDPGDGAMHHPR